MLVHLTTQSDLKSLVYVNHILHVEEVSYFRRLGVQLTQHMTDDTTAPATSTTATSTTTTSNASPPRTWTERRPRNRSCPS